MCIRDRFGAVRGNFLRGPETCKKSAICAASLRHHSHPHKGTFAASLRHHSILTEAHGHGVPGRRRGQRSRWKTNHQHCHQGKIGKVWIFFDFSGPWKNCLGWPQMRPGRFFFPANPDLADILGDTDFDFENFLFFQFCLVPNFWLGPSLGPAWAQLGPAWARAGALALADSH